MDFVLLGGGGDDFAVRFLTQAPGTVPASLRAFGNRKNPPGKAAHANFPPKEEANKVWRRPNRPKNRTSHPKRQKKSGFSAGSG
jgi:hypothetical protein